MRGSAAVPERPEEKENWTEIASILTRRMYFLHGLDAGHISEDEYAHQDEGMRKRLSELQQETRKLKWERRALERDQQKVERAALFNGIRLHEEEQP